MIISNSPPTPYKRSPYPTRDLTALGCGTLINQWPCIDRTTMLFGRVYRRSGRPGLWYVWPKVGAAMAPLVPVCPINGRHWVELVAWSPAEVDPYRQPITPSRPPIARRPRCWVYLLHGLLHGPIPLPTPPHPPLGPLMGGGSPMSPVDFKKWQCPLSQF